ncbi:tRNA guanosine(34) transglycosylase Tgt [Candidatus Parcubacteria bacterium]|nr:MAG: tRNA guanosine(34) transglycosylase Tgt [Candidatus Parcubacteria bacterium]
MFKIIKKSKKSRARLTRLGTAHGRISGPFFMTIATRGAVKNLSVDELKETGAEIILSNTYHLLLEPGMKIMEKAGGLHNFMNWQGPILTDSGGYQVFSLSKHRQISKQGVSFHDPKNGRKYFLTPEAVIKIQKSIGSDIMMVLDECPPYPSTKNYAKDSLELTLQWARRCKMAFTKLKMTGSRRQGAKNRKQLLFGIVQGGTHEVLRIYSAKETVKIGFDGYAIGGVAVGEPQAYRKQVLHWVIPNLPENKPRYLMGVGRPDEIVEAVKNGIDMFDCVIPTREARHGRLYLWKNPKSQILNSKQIPNSKFKTTNFYKTVNIFNAKFKKDMSPVNDTNLKQYSKAYLHHLFRTNEPLGMRLATLNNVGFYLQLMRQIRQGIMFGDI